MKINDKVKNIKPLYDFEEHDQVEQLNTSMQDVDPDFESYAILENERIEKIYEENEAAFEAWKNQGEVNLKLLRNKQIEDYSASKSGEEPNYIGERILFLRHMNGQSANDLYETVGISRSSLYRCEMGLATPSEKMLRKIIEGLYVSVADFCYEPYDFEKWKDSLIPSESGRNIFEFQQSILQQLQKNIFYYKLNNKQVRLPNSYFVKLKKFLECSFDILELLPHDK